MVLQIGTVTVFMYSNGILPCIKLTVEVCDEIVKTGDA